jgi:predicted amidohydrolase YtcJ
MVTRKDYKGRVWGPNQKVTVDEALTIGTINGAYASSEEQHKGSITAASSPISCSSRRTRTRSIRIRS